MKLFILLMLLTSSSFAASDACRIHIKSNSGRSQQDVEKLLIKKGYTLVASKEEADLHFYSSGFFEGETTGESYLMEGFLNDRLVSFKKRYERSHSNIPGQIIDHFKFNRSIKSCKYLLKKTLAGNEVILN